MARAIPGDDLASALSAVGAFLDRAPLTGSIAELEAALDGSTSGEVAKISGEAGFTGDLLRDATTVRDRLGRVSDLIHAAAIVVSLPELLEPGEVLARPSLAAGNDPLRPFDLESNRRVAEFKLGNWTGSDAMRKRHAFQDLVNLAAEESGRSAELYVRGERPIHFLRTSRSTAAWALDRSPSAARKFEARFGSLDMAIADFTGNQAAHVQIIDLEKRLPQLFGSDPAPA